METIKRYAPMVYRAQDDGPGVLEGVAVKYNQRDMVSGAYYETFSPGCFGDDLGIIMANVQHDRSRALARSPDGGLTLTDSATELRVRLELPDTADGRDVRTLVENNVLTGFSIEGSIEESTTDEADMLHTITRCSLHGVAVVDQPALQDSKATIARFFVNRATPRRASGGWDFGKRLRCECSGPDCSYATFNNGAFDDLKPILGKNAKETAAAVKAGKMREILATFSNYDTAIASLSKGTLMFRMTKGKILYDIVLQDSDDVKRLAAASQAAGVVGRPYLDANLSKATKDGDVMVYETAVMRALVISSTDAREGWDPVDLGDKTVVHPGKAALYGAI